MRLLLVGAGGHARAVSDLAACCGHGIAAFVDRVPVRPTWLADVTPVEGGDAAVLEVGEAPAGIEGAVIGLGGVWPDQLAVRLVLYDRYAARFAGATPALVHPRATVAEETSIAQGALVMAGVVINAGAKVGRAALVNGCAYIEHEAVVGEGAHIAPGAIVLGGARIGAAAMIGAGAVVLPGASVPDGALVKSLTRFAGNGP